MIWRSSALSVPERMVRFLSSSAVRKVASCPALSIQRYWAMRLHALDVGRAHRLAADVAGAQERAVVIELAHTLAITTLRCLQLRARRRSLGKRDALAQ